MCIYGARYVYIILIYSVYMRAKWSAILFSSATRGAGFIIIFLLRKKQRVFCGIKCQITKLMCLVFKLWKSFVGKMLYIVYRFLDFIACIYSICVYNIYNNIIYFMQYAPLLKNVILYSRIYIKWIVGIRAFWRQNTWEHISLTTTRALSVLKVAYGLYVIYNDLVQYKHNFYRSRYTIGSCYLHAINDNIYYYYMVKKPLERDSVVGWFWVYI